MRAGLRALLEGDGGARVVWEVQDLGDLASPWPVTPEVALVDDRAGPGAVEALACQAPELGVVILGGDPARYREPWGLAARGYVRADAGEEELRSAVRAVALGYTVLEPSLVRSVLPAAGPAHTMPDSEVVEALTPRELQVLQLLATGLPNKGIAAQLGISEHTAKFHVSSLFAKLGSSSRAEAVATASRRGLLLL